MSPNPAKVRIFRHSRLLTILLITILIVASQPPRTVQAAVVDVDTLVDENDHSCSDGDCSLRDAVETASFTDMIVFSLPGTIYLGSPIFIYKNLLINGPGEGKLILDGGGTVQIFEIFSAATNFTISGLTFSNGLGNDDGGAIFNSGTVTINNSVFSDNDGEYGGTIKNDITGNMTINNSVFVNNYSSILGGAIFNFGQLTINDCDFSGNDSKYGGGALFNSETGTMTINDSTFYNNNSTLASGGAITNNDGIMTINNSTITGNTAKTFGGGISARYGSVSGTVNLNHCTITENTADVGGGLSTYRGFGDSANFNIKNSIIASNVQTAGSGEEDCYNDPSGTYTSLDYNLTGNDTGCSLAGAHDQTTADAMLRPLADNGGGTDTHALITGSPALNQIPDGTNGCGTTYTEDQRGVSRPQEILCDIGSYESDTTIIDNDKVGFYDPATKIWRLRSGNTWSDSVNYLVWGPNGGGWTPVTGDWDNDGVDEVGFFDPATKIWRMRTGNTWSDSVNYLVWGPNGGGWTPVTGDWDNDGVDEVGFFDPATKIWRMRTGNTWSDSVNYLVWGPNGGGWTPVTGDWDNDGTDEVGFYDPVTKIWRMRTGNTWSDSVNYLVWGPNGGGWTPVTGDWDNDGIDEVGFYDPVTKIWRMRTGNTWSDSVNYLVWGPDAGGWIPVIGDW